MRAKTVLAAGAAAVLLGTTATALAGTVTADSDRIVYDADVASGAGERVEVGIQSGVAFVYSDRGVSATGGCTQVDPNRVECSPTPAFTINMRDFDDDVRATVPANVRVEIRGNGGSDAIATGPGNDVLDGGAGDDYLVDGPGDDSVSGGPNQDGFTPGPGRDAMSGGDGVDSVDYRARTGGVTITADGIADDGEAGEGDNVGADIESLFGGSGNDVIVAGSGADTLRGGAGNDRITVGAGEQRVEGDEGDDVIDTRDGIYDNIDCGPGTDTLLADPGDFQTGCEVAPDRDGDGTLNEADCGPDNPAVRPGAGEIFGNPVDEDCANGPGYFKVVSGFQIRLDPRKRPARVRFANLNVSGLRGGDRIEVRCRTKRKGCPFSTKVRTTPAGRQRMSLTALFKRRYLRPGAVVEIRVLRVNHVGRVLSLRVTKSANVSRGNFCLLVGATKPGGCPAEG